MSEIFICVGELSGDLHGERLLQELWKLNPSLKIYGIAGPRMRKAGMECLIPMENLQVMGFLDVFFALPKLIKNFYRTSTLILKKKPDLVLSIDYPGFNLRLAKHLRKRGFSGKLCHFISPTIWAWRRGRIDLMARTLDLLLVIFPFEPKCFAGTPLKVSYVGHPLIERLKNHPYKKELFPKNKRLIALFPGSRKKELLRNLPLMLRGVQRLRKRDPDLLFAVSLSQESLRPVIETMLQKTGLAGEVRLVPAEESYELMQAAHLAIAKSGTITLELALHHVPTLVIYQLSLIDFLFVKYLFRIRLPHYCIVNILSEKEVYPEFIGHHLDEETIFATVEKLLTLPDLRQKCQRECALLTTLLQEKEAPVEAAKEIGTLLNLSQ
jgi:lipid-A-disaccharide synthase